MQALAYKYYSKKEIQEAIFFNSKNREVAVSFADKGFGKRPDILQYPNDILELAKQGATSFHFSEEHWSNPLLLKPGMTKQQLDELRTGFDLILDIDCPHLEYAKICANLLVEALKFNNIKNFSIKFSGGSGFHIGLPFKLFPEKVNNIATRLLFPDAPRVIAAYLKEMIKEHLAAELLSYDSISNIALTLKKKQIELLEDDKFNPFSVLDIDTVLISNRHMYRSAYSLNEKKGFVSLPIPASEILDFKTDFALPEKVVPDLKFLDDSNVTEPEANQLIIQAFDWKQRQKPTIASQLRKEFVTPTTAIKEEFFPPCIQLILKGLKTDGRKRALFILTNFLTSTGYDYESINKLIEEWNTKNYKPLKQGYINSQIAYFKKSKQRILPPNCENSAYYQTLQICKPDNLCRMIKNPVNYSMRRLRILKQNKPKRKKKPAKP